MAESERNLTTEDLASNGDRPEEKDPGPSAGQPDEYEAGAEPSGGKPEDTTDEGAQPLLSREESDDFLRRWEEIQISFVDEPRGSVEQADRLVAELMKRLAETFAERRSLLEERWDRGDEVGTEDLRVALHTYRSFFQRLLSL
jgi:hypothetical protein